MENPKFGKGTTFKANGVQYTVIDHHTTLNLNADVVRQRYVATHEWCGAVTTCDSITEAQIERGLIETVPFGA